MIQTEALVPQATVLTPDEVQDLRTLQDALATMEDQDLDAVWLLVTADALRRRRALVPDPGPDPVLRMLASTYELCAEHGRDEEGCADDELPHTWPVRLFVWPDET